MKNIKYLKLFFVAMIVPSIFAEYINLEKLNKRNDTYFPINSQIPYSGNFIFYHKDSGTKWESIANDIELLVNQVPGQSIINKNEFFDFIMNTESNKQNLLIRKMVEIANIHSIGAIKDGKFHGRLMSFSENGQVIEDYFKKNGKNDGNKLAYYSDGQIYKNIFYIDGVFEGLFEEYHPNGQLRVSGKTKNGKWDGTKKEFFPNGQMALVAEWLDGKLNGQNIIYYKSGQINTETFYNNGVKGVRTIFYDNGQIHEKFMHEGNSYEAFHRDGSIAAIGTVDENSEIVGDFKIFAKDGTLLEHSIRPNGFYKRFHADGSIELETNLKDNMLDGKFLLTRENTSSYYKSEQKVKGVFIVRKNTDGYLEAVGKSCKKFGENQGRMKWTDSINCILNDFSVIEHTKIRRCLSVLEKRELEIETKMSPVSSEARARRCSK